MSQIVMHAAAQIIHAAVLYAIACFALNCLLFAVRIARGLEDRS